MSDLRLKIKDCVPGVLLSLAFAFLLILYAPVSIYMLNMDEFAYDFRDLFSMLWKPFVIFFIVGSAVFFMLRLIGRKSFFLALGVGFVAFICTYMQGTFLSGNLPALNGDPIVWGRYDYLRYISIALWVVAGILCVFSFRKLGCGKTSAIIKYASAFIFFMLLVSLALTGFSGGFRRKSNFVPTYDGILDLSSNENLVVLVLDQVDGKAYRRVAEKHDNYSDVFEDFTYYKNTMCTYPYTSRSIPFILTGKWYENEQSFSSYRNEAYSESPLLNELESRQYNIGLYESELQLNGENMIRFSNCVSTENTGFMYPLGFYKVQLKLVGYRYFPYDFKKLCELTPAKIDNSTLKYIDGADQFYSSNEPFYNMIVQSGINVTNDTGCFRFIHVAGAHTPFVFGDGMQYVPDPTYETSIEASISIARELINAIKEAGVYDNTAIIIMSDHGFNESEAVDSENPEGRQNPILFIKGIDEHHAYTESDAAVSYDDLQNIYSLLIQGHTGEDLLSGIDISNHPRRYLEYSLYDFNLYEKYQYGDAWDETTLKPTGTVYYE